MAEKPFWKKDFHNLVASARVLGLRPTKDWDWDKLSIMAAEHVIAKHNHLSRLPERAKRQLAQNLYENAGVNAIRLFTSLFQAHKEEIKDPELDLQTMGCIAVIKRHLKKAGIEDQVISIVDHHKNALMELNKC